MFNIFAYGRYHKMESVHDDYHIAIIIGLIFLVVVLCTIIIMLLTHKHPMPAKSAKPAKKTKTRKK